MAAYKAIMQALRTDIAAGRLRPGDRVPSENELVAAFGVSRMTANRAVRELAQDGLVIRTAGSGTHVAQRRLELSLLRVPDIAEEIRADTGRYSARLIERHAAAAAADIAAALGIAPGAPVFHTVIVHDSAGRPFQLEDRYVNPAFAPEYLDQDFTAITPNAYLTSVASFDDVEQTVEAVPADVRCASLLAVPRGHACLMVTRRTWRDGMAATLARLVASGETWRLNVRFRPDASGKG
jgi:GntR family transcriptional regulator, histidine utilization repressor